MTRQLPLDATLSLNENQIKEILKQYLTEAGYDIKTVDLIIARGYNEPDTVSATIKVGLAQRISVPSKFDGYR
jgi:hypothetical protein